MSTKATGVDVAAPSRVSPVAQTVPCAKTSHVPCQCLTVRGQRYKAFSPEPSQAVVGGHLYAVPSETARVGLKVKAPIWRCGTVVRDGPRLELGVRAYQVDCEYS